ncbi:SOS response-associated peptidase [Cellulomonas edaphi]|uniref:Abasic site processing protein n=1 Tax=Cellulomonas edaphi TaxID=3053468 RepID=A0ABT7S5G0_9CELL|nr:SOS response-associated peptidase [Cellulomons edaphi]MDM7830864.1 SOS response-associated peptidase [Cellulomons edaphi]
MCGRYASFREDQALADEFAIATVADDVRLLPPSWNVAPTDGVRIVVERADADSGESTRQLRVARWGLVPSWAKDPSGGARLINARVESLTEKPSFRSAAARRRAIVPMDGYFEWQKGPDGKTPYYLTSPDRRPLAAAGLYELWPDPLRDPDDPARWLWSVTVVTTSATDTLGHIHDRSPLVLPAHLWDDWLDPTPVPTERLQHLLASVPEPHLVPTEVGPAVGNVRHNGPELIEPALSE